MTDTDSVRDAYDRLAPAFSALAPSKAHNALYDRPAMQSLLPPLPGRRVLEPQPLPAFAEQEPKDYAELMRRPGFICFRALKDAPIQR